MALVGFELHHKHKSGTRQIRISYYCENGSYYKASTYETVREGNWDKDKGRCKKTAKNAGVVNQSLDDQQTRLEAIIRQLRANDQKITPDAIRSKLKGETRDFWGFFNSFISNPPQGIGKSTRAVYGSLKSLLERFQKEYGEISFKSFNQGLINELTLFMREEEYNDNSIKLYFSKIVALLNHAQTAGAVETVPKLKNLSKGIRAAVTYCNPEEINKIYATAKAPIKTDYNKRLVAQMTKIYVLGTQLGLRFSDLKCGPENVFEDDGQKYLNLSNKKTVGQVIIPLSELAIEILTEFNWTIPKFSIAKMNDYLPDICKAAGLNEVIVSRSVIGGKMVEETYFKWELITSHTMRRSFATNAFLAGVPVAIIMKITGHTTIESFMLYICVSEMEAAKIMAKQMKMIGSGTKDAK